MGSQITSGETVPDVSVRSPFDWLNDPHGRPTALRRVLITIQRGCLEGTAAVQIEKRAALVETLWTLFEDSRLAPGELEAVCRILFALCDPGLRSARKPRNREPRGRR
jgi:hypothetical protein